MRQCCIIPLLLLIACADAWAQTLPADITDQPPATEASKEEAWEFSISAYTYIVPNSHEYVQPTITADRGWLHLEARYNYEDQETGSVWLGYNFSFGDKLTVELTPMLGGVFGNTTGIAPGYKASISYWKLNLYTEGEYVFDVGNTSDSFFYTWTELTLSPVDWLRVGLVIQRTKAYDTDFDIQHGFLIGVSYKGFDFATYVLNPEEDPTFVFAVALHF
jgi:hypothetical protein